LPSKNNNNNSNKSDINNNKFVDFFPGFKLQQEEFSKAKLKNNKSWPYIKSVTERSYERFITDVVNPSNGCYYPITDENNYSVSMSDNDPRTCRHIVNSIIRIRLPDSSEKLYSLGQLIGYDQFSIRRTMPCDRSETYKKVVFGYDKRYNNKTKRVEVYTTGPIRAETVYLLDWSPENFDKLYSKTWDGKNPYFKPSKRGSQRVVLIVKDASTQVARQVYFHSPERSIELFKTLSFDTLMQGSYLPPAVREEKARFSSGLLGEQVNPNPTPANATNNTAIGPTSSTSNTSAYK
jgi:hypothetical protein